MNVRDIVPRSAFYRDGKKRHEDWSAYILRWSIVRVPVLYLATSCRILFSIQHALYIKLYIYDGKGALDFEKVYHISTVKSTPKNR